MAGAVLRSAGGEEDDERPQTAAEAGMEALELGQLEAQEEWHGRSY